MVIQLKNNKKLHGANPYILDLKEVGFTDVEIINIKEEFNKEILTKEVSNYKTTTINNIYLMIAGREVNREQEAIYSSKLWCAKHISGRTPVYTEQIMLERNLTKDELIALATKQLEPLHQEHLEAGGIKNTIEEYANYIVDVSIFWKDAKSRMILAVGNLENKILRVLKDNYDKAREMFEEAKKIKANRELGGLNLIVDDLILKIGEIKWVQNKLVPI
jgi:predicted metal-binding transcription factor (methanogenesis marker protein 9)